MICVIIYRRLLAVRIVQLVEIIALIIKIALILQVVRDSILQFVSDSVVSMGVYLHPTSFIAIRVSLVLIGIIPFHTVFILVDKYRLTRFSAYLFSLHLPSSIFKLFPVIIFEHSDLFLNSLRVNSLELLLHFSD